MDLNLIHFNYYVIVSFSFQARNSRVGAISLYDRFPAQRAERIRREERTRAMKGGEASQQNDGNIGIGAI